MKISVAWCLHNISKSYRIHDFKGTIEQFKECLIEAKKQGIEFTIDIPESLINQILFK